MVVSRAVRWTSTNPVVVDVERVWYEDASTFIKTQPTTSLALSQSLS